MDFSYNAYSIFLIVCGLIIFILSLYIFNRGKGTVRLFSTLMFANAIWSVGYGFELASSTLPQIVFFLNLEYIGIATVPLFWFIFCLHFCGKESWYKKPINFLAILSIPLITIILNWTNFHQLYYKEISLNTNGPFPMANIVRGPLYFVFVAYFYLLLACGSYIIIQKFNKSDHIYRNQNYSILIAVLIPWLANLAYLFGFKILGRIDITPFAFIIATFLIFIGIYRFQLFDIIPIAREKILELMEDGFLVLDGKQRIIDYNKSLKKYISSIDKKNLIGVSIEDIFPNQPKLIDYILQHQPGKVEIKLQENEDIIYLEASILFLDENIRNNNYSIIKLQDLTALKKDAIRNKEQTTELERLNTLKDKIFSIIAHDLRGPLVNLSEVLKLMTNDQITTEEFKLISPTLSKDIIYTTDLLENILHWSRSQLKGFGVKKEYFNLRNLIMNEINYHLPSATTKKIQIIHDVFPEEIVYADMIMIQIVIRNILNNAIKFCKENSEINITAAYQKNKMMLIHIKDNGVGMPKKILDQLFVESNITTRGTANERGTGLGLIVCKDFMQRNDGDIKVESIDGKGSSFYLFLPTSA